MMSECEYEMWALTPALLLCISLTFQIKVINHYHFLCKLSMPRNIIKLEENWISNQWKVKTF